MFSEEVIGRFVSFELMVKDSKHIVNLELGATSTPEVKLVAFKATKEKEEPTPTNRLPIDASKLNKDKMALILKSFRQILKQRKGKDYKPRSKRVCYRCGKSGHYIAKYSYTSDSDRDYDKKGKKMEKKKYYNKKKVGEPHIGREWDSDESSTDSSSDEDAANITINKGLLFPNVCHKCLMAKDSKKKKVFVGGLLLRRRPSRRRYCLKAITTNAEATTGGRLATKVKHDAEPKRKKLVNP
jgi:hypothetical protein